MRRAYVDSDRWLDVALAFTREHPGQPIADDAEDCNRKACVLWLGWKAEYPTWRVEQAGPRRRRASAPRPVPVWLRPVLIVTLGAALVLVAARLLP